MQTAAVEPMIQVKVVLLPVAPVAVRLQLAPSYLLNVMAVHMIIIIQMVVMVLTLLLCRTQTQLIVETNAALALFVMNTIVMAVGIGKAIRVDPTKRLLQRDMPLIQKYRLAVLNLQYTVCTQGKKYV
jgi:hypothetical protein